MKIERLSIPVNFDLSFLKVRWSDHLLIYPDFPKVRRGDSGSKSVSCTDDNQLRGQPLGEAVVYGGDWPKAERLARQMARMKFGARRGKLPVCEQVFIGERRAKNEELRAIKRRGSNLKIKVGRSVFQDIATLQYIKQELKFPGGIRIDANQGYSLKQLQYLIPTLKEVGVGYVEEPVKRRDLFRAAQLLHQNGLKVILDETLQSQSDWDWAVKNQLMDAVNIKLSRIGDLVQALKLIKLAKKNKKGVVIGCSEELERGMKAIYSLGLEAKKQGVLLEAEGFGPRRLKPYLGGREMKVPRQLNRLENLFLIISHRTRQLLFDLWWSGLRFLVGGVKQTRLLSSLSLHLVKLTGKHSQKIHPKHLVFEKHQPAYMDYIGRRDRVLDIGCGNGQHSLRVARRAELVVGFDTDQRQLAQAKESAKKQRLGNVVFRELSAEEKLDFRSGSFSRVLFLGVLEHLKNRDQILAEIHRVLEQRGLLLLGVPHEGTSWKKRQARLGIGPYTDPDHQIEYTRKSVTDLLEEHGFSVKEIEPTAYDTPWAGLIDLTGGFSLKLYEKLIRWKWRMARSYPEESISFFIIAQKG